MKLELAFRACSQDSHSEGLGCDPSGGLGGPEGTEQPPVIARGEREFAQRVLSFRIRRGEDLIQKKGVQIGLCLSGAWPDAH